MMARQRSCLDPTPDALTVLDRLAGLSKVISPAVMEQALLDTGRAGNVPASCRTVSCSGWCWPWACSPICPFVRSSNTRGVCNRATKRPRSNLCEARQRLGVEPVQRVFDLVVKPLATPQTPGAFYHGLRLMGIDGTVLDVPDTSANEAHFGRSSGGRGDSAFPQVRKVSLVELGTHVEVAMAVGGYHDSEQKLVEQLWDHLPPDALLLEDRGFFSYAHWKKLDARGTKLLIRLKDNLILRSIQRLPDGSFLAKIYPSPQDRDKDRDGIIVRVIEYTLNDPERTGHGETHRLANNQPRP